MRIRRSAISPVSPSPTIPSQTPSPSPSPSPSSCSSSSSCFSSSTTTHSTVLTHSLISSSNSTSSSSSPSLSLSYTRRCQGLDLLVKAVYYVAGSVVGVPYIQRRAIRRRKPALRFSNFVINSDKLVVDLDDEVVDCTSNLVNQKKKTNNKQRKRSKALPSKYHDSVLPAWKPRDRRRRTSSKA